MVQQMRGVVVPQYGGPEVYEARELPVPRPASGHALVRLEMSGVNFLDVTQRKGATGLQAPFAAGVQQGSCPR